MVNSTRSRDYKNPSGKITRTPRKSNSGKTSRAAPAKKAKRARSAPTPRKRQPRIIELESESDVPSDTDVSDIESGSDVDMDRSSDLDYNEERNVNLFSDGEDDGEARKSRTSRTTVPARRGQSDVRVTRPTPKSTLSSGALSRATPTKVTKQISQRRGSGRKAAAARMAIGTKLVAQIRSQDLFADPTDQAPSIASARVLTLPVSESPHSAHPAPVVNIFDDVNFEEFDYTSEAAGTQSFDPVVAFLSTGDFDAFLNAPPPAQPVTTPMVDLSEPMDIVTEGAMFDPIYAMEEAGAFEQSSAPVGGLTTPEATFEQEYLPLCDLNQDAVDYGRDRCHPVTTGSIDPSLLENIYSGNGFGDLCLEGPLQTPDNVYVPTPDSQLVPSQMSEYVLLPRAREATNTLAGTNELDDLTEAGKYHADPKAFPEELPNFQPQPYTGPRARVLGTIRTRIDDTKTTTYTHYEPLPDWLEFKYTKRGYLNPDITFTPQLLKRFIVNHPLGQNLIFRLEKPPTKCNHRYPGEEYQLCRATACFSDRRIKQGQIRVAIEEVWGRIPRAERQQSDPYVTAGYLHVHCFEYMIDLRAVAKFGMLRDFPRETFRDEPAASKTEPNRFCLSNALQRLLKLFNRKLILEPDWMGYKTNIFESLSVRMWVRGSRSATQNFKGGPPWLTPKDAERLIKERKPDPGWGGQRYHGLKSHIADELYAKGERHKLGAVNDPDNNRQIQRMVEEREKQNAQQFFDASDWLESVFSVDASWRTEECVARKRTKRKRQSPEPV